MRSDIPTSDSYEEQMFNHVRSYLTAEEIIELLSGELIQYPEGGIEALEYWTMEGVSEAMQDYRPPAESPGPYAESFRVMLENVPEKLQKRIFESEIDIWRGSMTHTDVEAWAEIELYKVGEHMFGDDYTDEILEVAELLDESESKLDLLDARDAIDAEEWHERTTELMEA